MEQLLLYHIDEQLGNKLSDRNTKTVLMAIKQRRDMP